MRKFLLLMFALCCAALNTSIAQVVISGPVKVCAKKSEVFAVVNPSVNLTYSWTASPGAVISNQYGTSTTVTFPASGTPDSGFVYVQAYASGGGQAGNGSFGTLVPAQPNPYITTNTRVGCERLYEDPRDKEDPDPFDEPLFLPEGQCMKACEYSSVVYTPHGLPGSTFSWTVTGGTKTPSGNNIVVSWGSIGQGTITVEETTIDGCKARYTVCVDIIAKPGARFGIMPNVDLEEIEVCLNQAVTFFDMSSAGIGSPIENWFWDFGDGFTYSGSTPTNPVHTYTTPGEYKVVLTVKNACNCTDVYSMIVRVLEAEGVTIECASLTCEGNREQYFINEKLHCDEYKWDVIGGSFSNNGSSVEVRWDQVDDDGFGYVTFDPTSCDVKCGAPTTIKIPVIKREGVIKGNTLVCTNNSYVYRLPAWPGTRFDWVITGSSSGNLQVLHTDQPNEIVINTTSPETITIECNYYSELVECGGSATLVVEVMDPAEIDAPQAEACQNGTATYTLFGSYNGNWQWSVKQPNNSTIYFDGPSNNPLVLTGLVAGGYTIGVVTTDFCAPQPVSLTVQQAPALPDNVSGPTTVCAGVIYEYTAGNATPGTNFSWTITQGTGSFQGTNTGVNVGVIFTGTGPWQLSVSRTNLQFPNCNSAPIVLNITPEQVPLVITGNNVPCPNSYVDYSVAYTAGEVYEWSISPQTAGSVSSGNGTPGITILWNNEQVSATINLLVRKCNQVYTTTFAANVLGLPSLTLSHNNEACREESVAINLNSSIPLSTANLLWNFGDGATETGVASGSVTTVNHTYTTQATSNVSYNVSVVVTNLNGCTISPITLNSTITIKPAPVVQITPGGYISFCNIPISQALTAGLQSGFGNTTSLTWHTPSGDVTCTAINSPPCNPYTGTMAGDYSVTATNDNGCSALSNVVRLASACATNNCAFITLPDVQITGSVNCGQLSLSGTYQSGGISPGWSILSPAVPGINPVNIVATAGGGTGTYQATFTKTGTYRVLFGASYYDDNNDLCPVSAWKDILVPLLPKMVYQAHCTAVTVTDQSVYEPGTVFSHYVFYLYDNNNNLLQTQQVNHPANSHTFNLAANATYKIKMVVYYSHSGYNGGALTSCETPLQTITIDPMPTAAFTFDGQNRCEKVPVYFTNTSTPATGLSYHWDFNDGATSLVNDPTRVYSTHGPRQVTLTVKNQNGCVSSVTQQVNLVQNLLNGSVFAIPQTVCEGSNSQLHFQNSGIQPSVYKWMNNTSLFSTAPPSVATGSSGYYWLRIENANRCYFNTNAVNVSVVRLMLPVIAGPTTLCENEPFTLSTYAGDPQQVWLEWFRSDNGGPYQSMAGGHAFEHPTGLPQGNYSYYAVANTLNPAGGQCNRTSAIFSLVVNPPPAEPVISFNMINCDSYEIELQAGGGSGSYNWSNGMSGSSITVNQGGAYKVWYTAGAGCKSEAEVYIPKDPKGYLWVLPEGCYRRCIPDAGITIGGPIMPFVYWEWSLNQQPHVTGSNSVPEPLVIYAPGSYTLTLDNGLCTASSVNPLNLSLQDDCPTKVGCVFEHGEWQITELDRCTWQLDFFITNINPVPIAYTVTVDAGGTLVPLNGVLQPGPNNISLQWNAPIGNGMASFVIRFWLPSGEICEYELGSIHYDCERKEEGKTKATFVHINPAENTVLRLAPNPVSSVTQVSYQFGPAKAGANRSLEVYDISGKRIAVYTVQEKGSLRLDLSANPSGIYLVTIKEGGRIIRSEKLVVAR